jgi:acyl-CoA thioesterase-1
MLAPRNMGADYARAFDPMYPELAKTYGAALYPFFLDGVATNAKLNQGDGLHPTAAGVDVIVAKILPQVEELIVRVRAKNGTRQGT